jgi:hypothetical protein
MIHALGLITMFWGTLTGLAVTRWLWVAGTRPWSWQRPIDVPKYAKHRPIFGSPDHIGLI